ncbi:hypothetical protein DFR38_10433 [Aquitalea magnusonii]|jgi:hypothetical protein|uniref:Uncharacterized protein n=1 Tax=Aquitalea magnusonii TaxID=332411 RepID=A0A318JHU3_9NEIS|nr:hypothetical protein DFR38_10433 [Aquitalea magnusonii]
MQYRLPFSLHRLKVQAWRIRMLPADQRRQAGKDLLQSIKHYLDRKEHGSDVSRPDF